ncbi:F-box protein CPR1-like [Silene latifolia]|uniref:F-box protein CPR1-like n=1 Tax=Silene latifolia TaxID=37657 RepID=UPI003D775138
MTQTTSRRSIPEDLIMEILSWLPGKTLLRFKSASKSFLNLIIRPEFVKLYLHRSRIGKSTTVVLLRSGNNFALADLDQPQRPAVKLDLNPDVINLLAPIRYHPAGKQLYKSKIIGICNGVVCFKKEEEFVLYNLDTRVYKQVPKPNALRRDSASLYYDEFPFNRESRLLYDDEFVYDCISDNFKIFRFLFLKKGSESYVYNLKDNSWLKIGNPPGMRLHRSGNHIASNYLYWIAYNRDSKAKLLVRFDISSNTYEEILLHPRILHSWNPRLGVLNGRLHITKNGKKPEVWMLKEDNCWTFVFRCSTEWEYPLNRCLFYSIDGRKIFLGLRKKVRKFICCDLDSQTTSVVEILGLPEGPTFKALPLK